MIQDKNKKRTNNAINIKEPISIKEGNKTKKFEERMSNWLQKRKFLQKLFIELTYECNLKCVHCYNEKELECQEIPFENIKNIIDEAYALGAFSVILSGGEATLHKDFLKIVKYIRKRRMSLEIYTNGQSLYNDHKLLKELIKIFPYKISLRLYSLEPEIHDKITGIKGSHYKTLSVINELKKNNISVGIKCFLTKYNADSYSEVVEFARKNGLSLQIDCKFINNPKNNNNNEKITNEQLYRLYSNGKSLFKFKPFNYNNDFFQYSVCSAGHTGLTISPDLNVYTCPTLKISLGEISRDSLSDIWNEKSKNTSLSKIRRTKKKDLQNCYKEEYCKYCVYCPGIAHLNNKYMEKYEAFCNDAKIKMKTFESKYKKSK